MDDFNTLGLTGKAEDVAADLNAEILMAIEYQEEGFPKFIDYEAIILDAIENFLRQFNGEVSMYDIFSEREIHNKMTEAKTREDIDDIVFGISGAVAQYLRDNDFI